MTATARVLHSSPIASLLLGIMWMFIRAASEDRLPQSPIPVSSVISCWLY
jgi:hypothetical protein